VATPTVAGVPEVDLTHILGTAVFTPATAGILDVNVKNIDNDTASASGTVTFPAATLASTTNITGGTITTVTNLTNAPTSGDLTATMKTSVENAVLNADMTGHQTQGSLGQAIGDPAADTNTIYKAVVTDATGATIGVDIVEIESQTDDIGAAGAGLTAIPWNAAWDAEVQSEVDDALVARNLHFLVSISGTADSGSTTTMTDAARTEADGDWWKGQLLVFTSGTLVGQSAIITDFNAGTDTFTFAPPTTVAVGTQNYVILPNVSAWDDLLLEHITAGSAGLKLRNLNALLAAVSAGSATSAGTTTTLVDTARTEADTNYWKGALLVILDGATVGQGRIVTGFNAGTDTLTFAPPLTQATAEFQNYALFPGYSVWDDQITQHLAVGTTASTLADILIDTAEIGVAGAGLTNINLPNQTMNIIGDITGNLSGSVGSVTGAVGSVTGNVGGNVTGSVGSVVGAVGSVAANGITASSLAADASTEIANGLLDLTDGVETNLTVRGYMRLGASALAGKLSGAATTTVTIRNAVADTKARITATVDADGNRTAVTTDVT
jgi:hypothetical protein